MANLIDNYIEMKMSLMINDNHIPHEFLVFFKLMFIVIFGEFTPDMVGTNIEPKEESLN